MTAAAQQDRSTTADDLSAGTKLLGGHFTVTRSLGAGGFGKTYNARDNVLGRPVVIKECFPEDFCMRHVDGKTVVPRHRNYASHVRSIVRMFMSEARSIAQLRHPSIVGVHSAFEENDTAYMVLDLLDGPDLLDILEDGSAPMPPARVREILLQLLDAIERVHAVDLLHRDISPDNVIIEKSGTPVLIDFGAARADASRRTRAVTSLLVVKDGYSPQEFYIPGSPQSPSSDLYALGATFYHVISGQAPTNSQTRMMAAAARKPDPCPPLEGRIEGYDPVFLRAIDTVMRIFPGERLQSAAEWRELIADLPDAPSTHGAADDAEQGDTFPKVVPTGEDAPAQDTIIGDRLRISLTQLVEKTNEEVRKSKQLDEKPKAPPPPAPVRPHAPDWLEEFNQQTLDSVGKDLSGGGASDEEPPPPDKMPNEIDWIERACEKQARLREERERALAAASGRSASRSRPPVAPAADGDAESDAAEELIGPQIHTFAWYLFAGLLIGLFTMVVGSVGIVLGLV